MYSVYHVVYHLGSFNQLYNMIIIWQRACSFIRAVHRLPEEWKSAFTLNGSVSSRGVLIDAHDERRPVQRAGRRRLEREQPVVVGRGGVRPRRERNYIVRRGLDEHLVHVGHVLFARPFERERGRLMMVVMVVVLWDVGGWHLVAAPRVVVMVVVLLRGAGRRVVRATATGRGGRRLSTVTARAAAATA